jgi:hypothetical protein
VLRRPIETTRITGHVAIQQEGLYLLSLHAVADSFFHNEGGIPLPQFYFPLPCQTALCQRTNCALFRCNSFACHTCVFHGGGGMNLSNLTPRARSASPAGSGQAPRRLCKGREKIPRVAMQPSAWRARGVRGSEFDRAWTAWRRGGEAGRGDAERCE